MVLALGSGSSLGKGQILLGAITLGVLVLIPLDWAMTLIRVSRPSAPGRMAEEEKRLKNVTNLSQGAGMETLEKPFSELNPFRITVAKKVEAPAPEPVKPSYVLAGVSLGKSQYAILKETGTGQTRLVRVGDEVGGMTVQALERGAVILTDGTEERRIHLEA